MRRLHWKPPQHLKQPCTAYVQCLNSMQEPANLTICPNPKQIQSKSIIKLSRKATHLPTAVTEVMQHTAGMHTSLGPRLHPNNSVISIFSTLLKQWYAGFQVCHSSCRRPHDRVLCTTSRPATLQQEGQLLSVYLMYTTFWFSLSEGSEKNMATVQAPREDDHPADMAPPSTCWAHLACMCKPYHCMPSSVMLCGQLHAEPRMTVRGLAARLAAQLDFCTTTLREPVTPN